MREVHIDDHFGLVCVDGVWTVVHGIVAEFILDYPSYDPSYVPGRSDYIFRGGLAVVTPADGDRYLEVLSNGVVPVDEIGSVVEKYGHERTRPKFTIDFDTATFTSAYFDQAPDDEVGPGWTGSYSDPMAAAPVELQAIWPPFPE